MSAANDRQKCLEEIEREADVLAETSTYVYEPLAKRLRLQAIRIRSLARMAQGPRNQTLTT